MIEAYCFGKISVNGSNYRRDLLIFPDQVLEDWWRREGHRLNLCDIEKVIEYAPDKLVVGTGAFGRMRITEEVKKKLESEGIELVAEKTGKAVEEYNKLKKMGKNAVAALHLTC